ncbi:MAG: hypothetical protein IT285_13680 [Bdellovibrionales bacterium]|nr:hypothetical protein [Bdellovibrionales bacterium]
MKRLIAFIMLIVACASTAAEAISVEVEFANSAISSMDGPMLLAAGSLDSADGCDGCCKGTGCEDHGPCQNCHIGHCQFTLTLLNVLPLPIPRQVEFASVQYGASRLILSGPSEPPTRA